MNSFKRVAALVGSLIVCVSSSVAEDWRSLRGPNYDGSASVGDSELAVGPIRLKVAWKRAFGSGYSSAVTSGDRVVCAMADREADQEFLVAMSAETGETLWKAPTGKIMVGANGSFDGPIATPAVDDVRAYHLTPFGDLSAYRLSDGEVVWKHSLTAEFGSQPNFYGFGASPLLCENLLIVPVGSTEGAVMAFEPETGEVVWKTGTDGAAFHAVVPVTMNGRTTLIAPGNTTLHSIDAKTGELLWSQPHGSASGAPVFSIVPVPLKDGGLFINDSRERSTVLDANTNGADTRWAERNIRNTYCVPAMCSGLLCSYSSRILVAVEPSTGKRVWRTRTPGNGFVATLAGRLVAATMDGSLHIGDVSKEGFQEVASLQVFDSSAKSSDGVLWSLPSISGRSIYLRSLGAIARIDVMPGRSQAEVAEAASSVAPKFSAFLKELEDAPNKQRTIDGYLANKTYPIVEGDHVHFVLQGEYQDVAVASELFGIRQERKMTRVAGTNLFYFGVKLPEPTRASYVYFADYKPLVDPKNDRQVVSSTLAGEMEPTFMGPAAPLNFSWFQKGDIGELTDNTDMEAKQLAGRLETLVLDSKSMEESIQSVVYLPPGYDQSQEDYPIVFVHDGEVALASGNQAAILDDLIRMKKVRPAIAVFIQKRFYPMQGPGAYPQMFGGELIPLTLKKYRVSGDRDDRASLSGGFGATLSLIGTLPASQLVGRIGCHSPFAFEMLHPAIEQLASLPNDRCTVFIDWGAYEFRNPSENWNMADQAQVLANILQKGGHRVTTSSTPVGSDWVCWRSQSMRMWQSLIGEPKN